MIDDTTPEVGQNEILFRQVSRGGNPLYYDEAKTPPLHRSLFVPTLNDTDGLSLIRSRFRTTDWAAYRSEKPEMRFLLAHLAVATLIECAKTSQFPEPFKFDVSEDSLDKAHGPPIAHCVASQINRTAYDNDPNAKKRIKTWAESMMLATAKNQISGPYPVPDDKVPYRPTEPIIENAASPDTSAGPQA